MRSSNHLLKHFPVGKSLSFLHLHHTNPSSAPVALSGVFCGIWVSRTLHFQKMTWLAWILLVLGTGLNALRKPYSSGWITYALRVIPAIGGGFLFQLPIYAVQSTIIDENLGIATASVTFFRSIGQAFGVAIGGTVFQNQFDGFLGDAVAQGKVPREFLVSGAQAAGAYRVIRRFPETVQIAYRYINADSLRTVWYVMTGIAGLGLLISLWVRNEILDRGNNGRQKFRVEERKEKEEEV